MTASSGAPAVRVDRVTKLYRRYGRRRAAGTLKSAFLSLARRSRSLDANVPALVDLSFEIPAGETVGIVGANGSGKSTLLKLLSGILRPTQGEVTVRGRLAALLELGAGFHPEISGRENIEINGLLLGLTRRQIGERFDSIVRFAELEEFLDAPLKTYSSGMAVRLGFSIAAHSDPDVLLVDEVLAVGDEGFAHRCLEKFGEFERAGKTIVFVSHDLDLVSKRCRRALWLDRGRLQADGAAAEIVARYRENVARHEGEQRLQQSPRGETGSIGSGAATVSAVRLVDAGGRPVAAIRSGEPARFQLDAMTASALSDFVFGFAITTVAGDVVFGTNTDRDGFSSERFDGRARVTLEIPALALLPGVYCVDAAIHARNGAPFDYRRDAMRFEVTGEGGGAGVWSPPRRWSFEGPVRWK